MSLYGDQSRRAKAQKAKSRKVASQVSLAEFKMAQRIAGVALPRKSYGWMPKVAVGEYKKYGDFGLATPNQSIVEAALAARPDVPTTERMKERQKAHATNSQTMHQSQMGLATQMTQRRAPGGIAQPLAPEFEEDAAPNDFAGTALPGEQMLTSQGQMQLNKAPSLAQILGSGVLTRDQIQSAAYNNVYSLINFQGYGANSTLKREMTYYMQRLILEGYNHGIDFVRMIKNEYGGQLKIEMLKNPSFAGRAGAGRVQFSHYDWTRYSDANKLRLFYHEMGHELMKRGHIGPYNQPRDKSIMTYADTGASMTRSPEVYAKLMREYFSFSNGPTLGSSSTRRNRASKYWFTPGQQNTNVNELIAQNPGWFPSVSGTEAPPPGGVTGPGGGDGGTGGGGGTTQPPPQFPISFNPMMPITFNTVNPVNVNPASGAIGSALGEPGSPAQSVRDVAQTPVQPNIQGINTHSFAAGLQQLASQGGGQLDQLGEALVNLKSG